MSSVASDSDEIILKQVSGCRRRLLCLLLIRAFAWSGTILITGVALSRFKIPGMPVLTIFIACFVAAYYLWHHYPRTSQVVRMIDERLSLKEGLVTAFQFRGSQGRFLHLLIRQLRPRLTGASSRQIFPFKIPGILLAWPFLLALWIVPVETGTLRNFGFHQNSEGMETLKTDETPMPHWGTQDNENPPPLMGVGEGEGEGEARRLAPLPLVPSHEGRGNKERGFSGELVINQELTKDDENNPPYSPFRKGGDSFSFFPPLEKGGKGGFDQGPPDEMSMSSRLTKDHENPMPSNVIPAQAGIQSDGRRLDFHSPLTVRGDKFRGNDSGAEDRGSMDVGMTDAVHSAVVQILVRQDIPQDYKEYVKNYFDVIQKEGLDHGDE